MSVTMVWKMKSNRNGFNTFSVASEIFAIAKERFLNRLIKLNTAIFSFLSPQKGALRVVLRPLHQNWRYTQSRVKVPTRIYNYVRKLPYPSQFVMNNGAQTQNVHTKIIRNANLNLKTAVCLLFL
jgi:hypothetical protein